MKYDNMIDVQTGKFSFTGELSKTIASYPYGASLHTSPVYALECLTILVIENNNNKNYIWHLIRAGPKKEYIQVQ